MPVNRWAARAVAVAGAALLGACTTLGPDFKRPEVPWLDAWTGGSLEPLATRDPRVAAARRRSEWWRRFNDPVLDRLVAEALRVNPNVRTAGLRIMEARAQLGIAGSSLYPQVKQATGEVLWAGEHEERGSDTSAVSFNAGLRASWELDFWGKFQRGIEAADAGYWASIALYDDVQVLMASQVACAVHLDPYRQGAASHRRRECGAPEAQPRHLGAAVQVGPRLGARRAAGQVAVPRARWRRSPRSRSACARRRTR